MTFRAKPVVKRDHRPAWETQDRRNFYLNLGFGLIVVLAVLILAIAAGLSYYNDHLASVGSVDGQSISKDEFADRYKIETWRLDEAEARIADRGDRRPPDRGPGHVAPVDHRPAAPVSSRRPRSSGSSTPSTRRSWPPRKASRSTPEDIDARLATEATTPESRHAWVIEVAPADRPRRRSTRPPTRRPRPRPRPRPRSRTSPAGKSWDDVAKTVSTDASTAPQAGDLGWLQADDTRADEAWLKAVFAAPVNTPTAVIEGADGIFRIGRVTEIAPSSVDPAYQTKFENKGIDLAKYRAVVQGDVIHEKLEDKIVADATGRRPAAPGRRDLHPAKPTADLAGRRRQGPPHPVLARRTTRRTRRQSRPAIPSWAAAQSQAPATYARLKADPNLFDAIARKESDETQAQGPSGTGGKLPYFDSGSTGRPGVHGGDHRAGPQGRRHPAAGQVRVRLARHPGHVPPDRRRAHEGAQDAGRRRRGLRDPRPRQLRGPVRRASAATSAGRQGPARRRAHRRHLRHADRQDLGSS